MCSAVCIGNVVLPWIAIIVLDHIVAQGRRNNIIRIRQKSSRFQQMNIYVLLARPASSDSLLSKQRVRKMKHIVSDIGPDIEHDILCDIGYNIMYDIGCDLSVPAGFVGSCCQPKSTATTDSEGQGHKI